MLEHLDTVFQVVKAAPEGTLFHPSELMGDHGIDLNECKVVVLAALAEGLLRPVYRPMLNDNAPWSETLQACRGLGPNEIRVAFKRVAA